MKVDAKHPLYDAFLPQACISARSIMALDGLVLYASPDGLDGVGADGGAAACMGGS